MSQNYLLFNGKIHTGAPFEEYVGAVLVEDGIFAKTGTLSECREAAEKRRKSGAAEFEEIDLGGRTVVPSFIDGHTHPVTVARTGWHVILPSERDKEKLLENIREAAEEIPKEEMPYFYAECYYEETFGEEGPTKELLDSIISDRPACIQEYTDHECWYNSMALEMIGVPKEEDESRIEKKAFFVRNEKGEATGQVLEKDSDIDQGIYEAVGWYPPKGTEERYVEPFLRFIREKGVCAIFDASTESEEALQMFKKMDDEGTLKMYYEGALPMQQTDDVDDVLDTIKVWGEKYHTDHVHINTIKVFFDGTNEIGTCSSLEPLKSDPEGKDYGDPEMTEDELVHILERSNEKKVDVHIHVVGDRGFRACCNAVERAKQSADSWDVNVTFAHCELIHPDDASRPAELGIFIDTTPQDAGGYYGEKAIKYLGKERWEAMYDYRSLLAGGAVAGHSSDILSYTEANRADPFFGMGAAATRIDREVPLDPSRYRGSIRPDEEAVLSVEQMMKGYTENNAVMLRLSDKLGTIEEGKAACLTVTDEDIFEIPASSLYDVDPVAVMFDGVFVWNEM